MAIGNILWPVWYILWSFGKFFPFLVCCTKKNLATLRHKRLWPLATLVPQIHSRSYSRNLDFKNILTTFFMKMENFEIERKKIKRRRNRLEILNT
jgi:hypothetical protein